MTDILITYSRRERIKGRGMVHFDGVPAIHLNSPKHWRTMDYINGTKPPRYPVPAIRTEVDIDYDYIMVHVLRPPHAGCQYEWWECVLNVEL